MSAHALLTEKQWSGIENRIEDKKQTPQYESSDTTKERRQDIESSLKYVEFRKGIFSSP